MSKTAMCALALTSGVWLSNCQPHNEPLDYLGQTPPGETAIVFAPGVISLPGRFERVPAFSPDGTELFFTVTTVDWKPTILQTKKQQGRWSESETTFFAEGHYATEPAFSPDGRQLYFASTRPPGSPPWNTDLWRIERRETGWSEPIHLGATLNSDTSDYHPSVARDGTLYFASTREGAQGGADLYRAERVEGQYQVAERLGDSINSGSQDWDPYISPDERLLIFKSDRPGGYGDMDLYISFKQEDGSWTDARNMGPTINTAAHEDAGDLSPDGRFLFFARRTGDDEMDIYWVDSGAIEALREKIEPAQP